MWRVKRCFLNSSRPPIPPRWRTIRLVDIIAFMCVNYYVVQITFMTLEFDWSESNLLQILLYSLFWRKGAPHQCRSRSGPRRQRNRRGRTQRWSAYTSQEAGGYQLSTGCTYTWCNSSKLLLCHNSNHLGRRWGYYNGLSLSELKYVKILMNEYEAADSVCEIRFEQKWWKRENLCV